MNETAALQPPSPYFAVKPGTCLGDYVTVPDFGHRGRVYDVHYGCPEDDWWKSAQGYDVAAEERRTKRWVSILVHDGGAVVFPETMVEPTEPFTLRNDSTIFYFGEGRRLSDV